MYSDQTRLSPGGGGVVIYLAFKMASRFSSKWLLVKRNFSVSSPTSYYWLMSFRSRNTTVMNALEFGMGGGRKGRLTSGSCAASAGMKIFILITLIYSEWSDVSLYVFLGFSSVAQRTETSGALHSTLLGPSVRHLLESYGLQNLSIQPSGHKGQLLKGDVLKYIHKNSRIQIDFTAQPRIGKLLSIV